MDNQALQKIRELIEKNDKIGIAVGKNPTVDAMAAALTLYLGFSEYGKRPSVVSATQPLVEHSSLVGIDKVKGAFEGDGGDLVVSFPYREGEIEKVSYTIESGFLNIVVKAGEQGLTFSESDVRFRRGGGAPSLLFIIGASRLSDLGGIFDPEALKSTAIVNIDNQPDNQGYGDVPLVQPNVPSVSELAYEILYSLGIDPSVDIAQNILHGINDGTNNMQDPRVSYTTFEVIANMMKKGATRAQPMTPPITQQPAQPRMGQQPNPFANRSQSPVDPAARFGQQQQQPPFPRPQMPRQGGNQAQGMQQRPPMPRPQMMPRRDMGQQQPPMPMQQPQDPMMAPDYGQPMPPQQPDMSGRQDQQNPRRDQGQPRRDQGQDRKPPSDWLQPKVYKGSSNV